MPATYKKADKAVREFLNHVLTTYPEHKPLLDHRLQIDLVMAYGERDGTGAVIECPLKKNGVRALAIARKIGLKDRAMGRGDVEICIDGDWWEDIAKEPEKVSVLDHEAYHFEIAIDKKGVRKDDLGRPKVNLRPHNYDFGWFSHIAERHGRYSQECQQAKALFMEDGQRYFPFEIPAP